MKTLILPLVLLGAICAFATPAQADHKKHKHHHDGDRHSYYGHGNSYRSHYYGRSGYRTRSYYYAPVRRTYYYDNYTHCAPRTRVYSSHHHQPLLSFFFGL